MLSLLETYMSQTLEKQAPDVNRLGLEDLLPYKYTPFADQYSLRLLEIIPSTGHQIQCRLETFNLHVAPAYDALSYTWGDPRPPLFQSIASSSYQKQQFIKCDDRIIHVTTNLHHALQRLRHAHRNSSEELQKYIWIDALCINQQDSSERSTQVVLMEAIYKGAQMVVAWLGKSDRYTSSALRLITRLADNPPKWMQQYGSLSEKFPDINHEDWQAVVAFFRRAYFRRAWIIQEVVLARKMVFFIGGGKIDWESLVKASRFINMTGTSAQLNILTSYFASLSGRMDQETLTPTGTTIAQLSTLREKPRAWYGSSGKVQWYTLVMPINIGRGFLATNRRDYFYSTLGIIKDIVMSSPNLDEHGLLSLTQLPVPDYTKSISTVFTEFASWQLEVSQNLSLLFMVEDHSFRSPDLKDCPSWVPDQSVAIRPAPLHVTINNPKWDPSLANSGIGLPVASLEGLLLMVRGGLFDTIESVTEPLQEMRPDAEGWIRLLNLIKPLLSSKYPRSGAAYADVLWRTLIADTHHPLQNANAPRQSPADSRLAQAFNEWLITRSFFFSGSRIGNDAFTTESYAKVSRLILKCVWDEIIFDAGGFNSPSEEAQQAVRLYEEHERSIYEMKKPAKEIFNEELKTFVAGLVEMSRLDPSGTFFSTEKIMTTLVVVGLPTANKENNQLFLRKDAFLTATKSATSDRTLVLTKKGYLALATKSASVGDQIWILSGPSTPFTLRPLDNGRYRLMGEAYVHGIMGGEAVKDGSIQFGDIELQ